MLWLFIAAHSTAQSSQRFQSFIFSDYWVGIMRYSGFEFDTLVSKCVFFAAGFLVWSVIEWCVAHKKWWFLPLEIVKDSILPH